MTARKRKPRPEYPTQANTTLHAALGITPHDLANNAQGCLSPAQRQRLRQMHGPKVLMGGTVLLVAGFAFGVLFFGGMIALFSGDQTNSAGDNLATLAVTGALGIILYRLYRHVENRLRDTIRPDMHVAQGRVYKSTRNRIFDKGQDYRLHIDDQIFTVGQMTWQAFRENALYRLYYTTGTRTVVGAEWLEHEHFDIIDAD